MEPSGSNFISKAQLLVKLTLQSASELGQFLIFNVSFSGQCPTCASQPKEEGWL